MTAKPVVLADKDAVVQSVADGVARLLVELTASRERVDVCLTGGSVGIAVLAALAQHPDLQNAAIDRVHWWWGDDRFVPADSDERNEKQAREALLDVLGVSESNINALAASDEDLTLDQAAFAATAELETAPPFALTLLGLGPDAHVASLFPGHPGVQETAAGAIAVRDSPKPPPERISLTLTTINASERVWIAAAGNDKADAVAAVLRQPSEAVPGSLVAGQQETLLFADEAAASQL